MHIAKIISELAIYFKMSQSYSYIATNRVEKKTKPYLSPSLHISYAHEN